MSLKNFLMFSLLLCLFSLGYGQIINVEKSKNGNEPNGFKGNFDFSLSLIGNSNTVFQLGNRSRVTYKKDRHKVLFQNNIQLINEANKAVQNQGFEQLRYNFRLLDSSNLIVWEVFEQWQYNSGQKIKDRLHLGSGARLNIISSDTVNLAAGVLFMYEYEALNTNPDIYNNDVRLSSYIAFYWKILKNLSVETTLYFEPLLGDISNNRFVSLIDFNLDINKHFSFKLNFDLRYNSNPAKDVPFTTYAIRNVFSIHF